LSPAYDLVPTALVNPNDTEELALNLNAKKKKLKYNDFLMAFENCGLSKKVLDNILELFLYALPEMEKMVYKSFAKEETKDQYITLLNKKYKQLGLL
jgi:serine/threonine-protein kinase HipA